MTRNRAALAGLVYVFQWLMTVIGLMMGEVDVPLVGFSEADLGDPQIRKIALALWFFIAVATCALVWLAWAKFSRTAIGILIATAAYPIIVMGTDFYSGQAVKMVPSAIALVVSCFLIKAMLNAIDHHR